MIRARCRLGRALVASGIIVGVLAGSGVSADAIAPTRGDAASCREPPLRMRLESSDPTAGGRRFRVTDAVARRVPIVPGARGSTGDPDAIARGRRQAARTNLALFSVYLADFEVPRRDLRRFGFGEVDPEPDGTVAVVSIVPHRERGFREGDVARGQDARYETTTTFAPLSVLFRAAEDPARSAVGEVTGRVEILELDDDHLCVDIDLERTRDDEVVAAVRGVVRAPIVRADESFYFT